jgi:hypothetical protein
MCLYDGGAYSEEVKISESKEGEHTSSSAISPHKNSLVGTYSEYP